MENYDVIIVGAGIAGCGLAYNLSKECPEKKVLIIDKKEPGANAAYGYRNTTEEIVKKYNLPYEHIYKGVKVGTADKTHFILNKKYYFIDYKKSCKKLLKNSNSEFQQEEAVKLNGKILKTNKGEYNFKILVDCSGHNFFAKRLRKQKIPFGYFIGKTRILKNKLKNVDYFYYQFDDSWYIEDFYPLKNKTIQGDWQYTKKIDFKQIIPNKKNLYKKYISNPEIIQENTVVVPTTPVLPLVYNNIAFLGDSFGNALTSSAFGVHVILDSSRILTKAIKEKNLKSYEEDWKKEYLDNYIKYLAIRLDTSNNSKFLQQIKKTPTRVELLPYFSKYPQIFDEILMCNPNLRFPQEIKEKFPKRSKLVQLYYYLYLKLKYASM